MSATKDNIITLPNKHLRLRSERIGVITETVHQLVADMESAVLDWDSSRDHEVTVALAAVQIDKLYRVVIVREDFDHQTPASYSALINPEIVKYEGDIDYDYEGCLSIKSVYATGFLARVLQHEIDHTNGKLFVDHIKDAPEAFFELTDKGKLEPLNFDTDIKNSKVLWA